MWEETLVFTVHMPEIALVRFLVWDHDPIGRDFIGQRTLAFSSMMPGGQGATAGADGEGRALGQHPLQASRGLQHRAGLNLLHRVDSCHGWAWGHGGSRGGGCKATALHRQGGGGEPQLRSPPVSRKRKRSLQARAVPAGFLEEAEAPGLDSQVVFRALGPLSRAWGTWAGRCWGEL